MKGLLKAWIQEPIDFSSDFPNKPQRQGVTLLFNDGGLNSDKVTGIVQALNGREVLVSIYKHFKFPDIEFLRCTISVGLKKREEVILDELYLYPHHLTLAWADGVYPVLAAELSQSIYRIRQQF